MKKHFQKAKYIIHLAGAGVADKPWTEKRKKEIVESRTKSSELLIKALKNIPNEDCFGGECFCHRMV